MSRNLLGEIFDVVMTTTGTCLAPLGFIRSGLVFRILENGNCGIIGFQRSVSSSVDSIRFTVNIGVVCGELLDSETPRLQKTMMADAHLSERVGMLLPNHSDKWWEITAQTDSSILSNEISRLILEKGVPYIKRYLATSELIALWESGRSPGLTAFQRDRCLSKLKRIPPST